MPVRVYTQEEILVMFENLRKEILQAVANQRSDFLKETQARFDRRYFGENGQPK